MVQSMSEINITEIINMKKRIVSLLLVGMMIVCLTGCTKLGKWNIVEVNAGDVVMSEEDISSMGLDAGFIKLNKSGSCVVNLLGDEYDGGWVEAEDGTISIEYGDAMKGTATIDGSTMQFVDNGGANYTLKK